MLYTSVLLVVLLISCTPNESTDQSPTLGTLEETLRVGAQDENAEKAHLFGRISEIATDEAGNIYVAAGQAHEIRVFDGQGTHLDTFGESGEGPGEFRAITAMMVDSNGRLIVVDPYNSRITILDKDGTLQESHTSPVARNVRQIEELPNGRFLLVGLSDDHLVHIVDTDFETIRAHLVPASEILYTEDELEKELWLPRMPGRAVPVSNDRILYVPAVYGGQLYAYERENHDTWNRARSIDAYPVDQRPLTIVEDGKDTPFPAPDGRGLQFSSLTNGLFAFGENQGIHVFSRKTKDGIRFFAGVVGSDGTYDGHFSLGEGDYEDHFSVRAYARDANHNLYLADEHKYPVVRRMSIPAEK